MPTKKKKKEGPVQKRTESESVKFVRDNPKETRTEEQQKQLDAIRETERRAGAREVLKSVPGSSISKTPTGEVLKVPERAPSVISGEAQLTPEQQQLKQQAEEVGVFEKPPELVELSPGEKDEEGSRYTQFQRDAANNFIESIKGKDAKKYAEELGISENELLDLIQNPESKRQIMLQELQRKELNKASTASQKLGTLLEPFLGDLKVFDIDIGKYTDKFLRMPKQESEEIVEQIKEIESVASGMTDAASQGEIGSPSAVLRQLGQMEEDIYIYEARIKKLVIASVELRANPEKVNIIERQILSAKETLFEAKQRAAEGALLTPTDSQLYLRLQDLK